MAMELSRRLLLGGALSGGALAAGGGLTAATAAAQKLQPGKMKSLYGPDPADAHLIFNENPFGPSPKALEELSKASTQGAYYQGKSTRYLAEMIAERHGVDPDWVTISNGSYEGLSAIAMAYGLEGKILGTELFWDSTARYAERNGITEIVRAKMTPDLDIDFDTLRAEMNDDISLVHIVNPNNPTGRMVDTAALKAFVAEASQSKPVLVDEAYIELSDPFEEASMMPFVKAGEDVIVSRTFSKIYGMAGLRVGYTIAKPEITAKFRPFIMSSPNVAGVAAAIASYDDQKFLDYSKSKLVEARQAIMEATTAQGLNPLPSQTSFVFVDTGMDADVFRDRMREKGVLIRGKYGEYTPYSRVSCGYMEDVERYVAALPYALNG